MAENTSNALVIERTFSAPVEKVWKAWSDPEEYKKWWGPKNFTAPVIKLDFRVGGTFLGCMRGKPTPDKPEQDFWSTGTYKEIVPMKKIVVTDSFADKDGKVVPSSYYGMEGIPTELLVTVTFEELPQGTTKMTLRHEGFPEGPNKELATAGWNESFDKLAASLQ